MINFLHLILILLLLISLVVIIRQMVQLKTIHQARTPLNNSGEIKSRNADAVIHLIDSVRQGIVLIDKNQNVLLSNKALQTLFHYDSETQGHTLIELTRSEKISAAAEQIIRATDSNSFYFENINCQNRDFKVSISPFQHYKNAAAVITFYDITEMTKAERVRQDFVANVSHELKTPLTSLKGFLETLLTNSSVSPDQLKKFLSIMKEDADRLERLIHDLLELSRIEAGWSVERNELTSTNQIIDEALALLEPQIRAKSIVVEKKYLEGNLSVRMKRDELKQVFINLIDNAVKYNRDHGSVVISAAKVTPDQINISVSDTGVGIAPHQTQRIFERFFRVDPARSRELGGTGLGLSIVKHIVENAHGNVSCTSELGKGSVFTVSIPNA